MINISINILLKATIQTVSNIKYHAQNIQYKENVIGLLIMLIDICTVLKYDKKEKKKKNKINMKWLDYIVVHCIEFLCVQNNMYVNTHNQCVALK